MSLFDWNLKKILETSGSFWLTCVLHASVRLDIFDVLENKKDIFEIANEKNCDLRALEMLLNALVAMELIHKEGSLYYNTPQASKWLSSHSKDYKGYIIKHHSHLFSSWGSLVDVVKDGKPKQSREHTPERIESFLMGMFNLAMEIAPQLCPKIDLQGKKNLLDLGGGPGTYSIHFCLANPELNATIYDLPTTEPFAKKTAEKFGLQDRISFMVGNYLIDEIKGNYDVAWLSHVLHSESPEQCEKMICKVVKQLKPGSLIMIHDFILDDTGTSPLFPTLFSINMLVNTDKGKAYRRQEIHELLEKAGVCNIQSIELECLTTSSIIGGTVS